MAGLESHTIVRTHFSPVVTAREIHVPNHEVCGSMAVQDDARPYQDPERVDAFSPEVARSPGVTERVARKLFYRVC